MKKLDLLEIFCAHAKHLLAQADAGTRLHRTSNIAESGDPFEGAFRDLLESSLPPSCRIYPGYFFDKDWELSPQQDIMICDANELVQFPPASNIAQRYVPLTCVQAYGQLKNTASAIAVTSALNQCASAIDAQSVMRQRMMADSIGRPYREEPLPFIAFANGGSKELVDAALKNFDGSLPKYILLIEPGLVYSRRRNRVFDEIQVDFQERTAAGPLFACTPICDSSEKRSGAALLWTIFSILAKLNWDFGNQLAMTHLINDVEQRYPLHEIDFVPGIKE